MENPQDERFWLRLTAFWTVLTLLLLLLELNVSIAENRPVTASAGIDVVAHQFEEIAFSAGVSPAASSAEWNRIYIWYFGDGETASGNIVKHAYRKKGNYTATVVIVNDDGSKSQRSIHITVLETMERSESNHDWLHVFGYVVTVGVATSIVFLIADTIRQRRQRNAKEVGKTREGGQEENADDSV